MAGYLFTLDSLDSLHECVESGVYSTYISEPTGHWGIPAEGTFADYATMRAGDNVYFFIKRMIYGVGVLTDVGESCRYENFPGSSEPLPVGPETDRSDWLVDDGERRTSIGRTKTQRWVCTFTPSPHFFTQGVDMDDVLSSNPAAFRMLRAMWKLSFIKFDDEENQAFKDAILKANQEALLGLNLENGVYPERHTEVHSRIARMVGGGDYVLDSAPILAACSHGGRIAHEMAIEAAIVYQLAAGDAATVSTLGAWDYLSHQVIASPFKPIDYMDKMDIFGYAFVSGFRPTISRYLVGELKSVAAGVEDIDQVMKYVDWTKDEYAHGDYSMIRAFLIAESFSPAVVAHACSAARRSFIVQRRPAITREWRGLRLLKCSASSQGSLTLQEVHYGDDIVSF